MCLFYVWYIYMYIYTELLLLLLRSKCVNCLRFFSISWLGGYCCFLIVVVVVAFAAAAVGYCQPNIPFSMRNVYIITSAQVNVYSWNFHSHNLMSYTTDHCHLVLKMSHKNWFVKWLDQEVCMCRLCMKMRKQKKMQTSLSLKANSYRTSLRWCSIPYNIAVCVVLVCIVVGVWESATFKHNLNMHIYILLYIVIYIEFRDHCECGACIRINTQYEWEL